MKPTIHTAGPGRNASRGLTMVELLIAVTLSLLLVLVLAQLFLGSRQSFSTTDDVSRLQENIRFTQTLLMRTVHLAGYKSRPDSFTNNVFSGSPALEATDGGAAVPDTLTVRYQGASAAGGLADGSVVDCLGVKRAAGEMAINVFSIAPNATTGRNGLFCSNTGVLPGVELVPDVQNMQIRFGEDINADLAVDQYVTLPEVANMANVLSVRVALLFQTPNAGKVIADSKNYTMNQVDLGTFPDQRIRRIVTLTLNLRNRTP